jgi:hypothetical protein
MKKRELLNTETFTEKVRLLTSGQYYVIGEYKGVHSKIRILHIECGREYDAIPNNLLRGSRCVHCTGRMRQNTEIFRKRVTEQVGSEYTVLGEYLNNEKKIKIRHELCKTEYDVSPEKFVGKTRRRCPECFGVKKKTDQSFRSEVKELSNGEYSVIGSYHGVNTKIVMKHEVCGHEWSIKPGNFIYLGNRCPKCNSTKTESKGSKKIRE